MAVRLIFSADNAHFPSASFPQYKINDSRRSVLSFDDTSTETAYFEAVAASGWSGCIGASVLGWSACAQSGSIVWQIQVEAVSPGDAVDMRSGCSFATAASVLQGIATGSGALLSASLAPDNDGAVAGDKLRFALTRLTTSASDDLAGDFDFSELVIADGR